jgi:hypothetical protein
MYVDLRKLVEQSSLPRHVNFLQSFNSSIPELKSLI